MHEGNCGNPFLWNLACCSLANAFSSLSHLGGCGAELDGIPVRLLWCHVPNHLIHEPLHLG